MPRKIAIIGTGYVGLTIGVSFASLGHSVVCVDKDSQKIEKLKKGIVPIFEPGLEKILRKYKNNLDFTDNLARAVKQSNPVFIAVGTPSREDGSIDMANFKMAVKEIAHLMNDHKTIVIKSTVPAGTGDWTKKQIQKYYKGNFSVVSNPEFLKEGTAVNDFLKPDRIIVGVQDSKAKALILDLYSPINAPKVITDIKSAELIKYASNAFLATKISFINEIANICERVGGDVNKVAEGIGYDRRIGKRFLKAGIGYGGSCLPKDIDGLIKISDSRRYNFRLLRAVTRINKTQQERFVRKIKKILKGVKGNTVCIWGLSFKPNTDDVRKSPAIKVIKGLQAAGYLVQAYDPVATENAMKELGSKNVKFCKTPLEAAQKADLLVLVTEWPEFSKLNMKRIRNVMREPYLLDGRNQFNPKKVEKIGFHYQGIGRKQI
jgi:UDPglucose 6-dehydrogenase